MKELQIPNLCLVVLVGVSGSGKSTFARKHFLPTEVLSSDACRGWVSDDETDQSATPDAFDVLYYIAGKRLAKGLLTVVDATSVQPSDRKKLVELARSHDVLPVTIVLDLPLSVCLGRNEARTDRQLDRRVVVRQHGALQKSLKHLSRERFRRVHVVRTSDEVETASIVREPLLTDRRTESGPFDVIGDVHGCLSELETLLEDKLGYVITRDESGRPTDASHPGGRRVIFLGDLVDRGPDSPGVLRLGMGMSANGNALVVPGNHENKLIRALRGRNVQVSHGLAETLAQLEAEPADFRDDVLDFCDGLVSHLVLDDGKLVVAHAGLKESYHNRSSGRVRSFALYGDTTGETDEFGLPVRYPWADDYRGKATVLYGHTPVPRPVWINNTMCLDTGCVFGGQLTALRYPEREVVSVPAEQVWYEPVRPLDPLSTSDDRPSEVVDIDDVLGRRVIETGHLGSVTIREESAAGALEVMSRFALDPAQLIYLPPTMAPCATSKQDGLLEHPAEAFAAYHEAGVQHLVCEEKHMGSRAVVLVRKEDGGTIHTRTGRAFFDDERTDELLARLRGAIDATGLWKELDTDWMLLDTELMPWSIKAEELLRKQYAALGAAGRSALPAAVSALQSATQRGIDVGDLLDRSRSRATNVDGFTAAYRRYCWPTTGLSGVRLAPFQLLATEGTTHFDRDHLWQMGFADRLAAADPEVITPTRHVTVDLADEASVSAATRWWEQLTGDGGEGMVVKPLTGLATGKRGLVQPGIKCRGREYLRIIYGPDYTEPGNLARLRDRNVGRKRSLAIREYALGVEALERVARGEPLWRVHECVFAILALESEAVDPRL